MLISFHCRLFNIKRHILEKITNTCSNWKKNPFVHEWKLMLFYFLTWLLNNQKNLLDCPRHTTLRQQLFFSLLDIPETISLNLLIFGSVNLNDEENKAVFKSVQTFIIKSKRFTPWHAYIIFFHLFNLIQSLCIIIFK